jgi:hypothetical protein
MSGKNDSGSGRGETDGQSGPIPFCLAPTAPGGPKWGRGGLGIASACSHHYALFYRCGRAKIGWRETACICYQTPQKTGVETPVHSAYPPRLRLNL